MSLHCRSHDRVPATTALLALLALVAMAVPSQRDSASAMQHGPDRLREGAPGVERVGCSIAGIGGAGKSPSLTAAPRRPVARLFVPASQSNGCAYQRYDGDAPVREASRVHMADGGGEPGGSFGG